MCGFVCLGVCVLVCECSCVCTFVSGFGCMRLLMCVCLWVWVFVRCVFACRRLGVLVYLRVCGFVGVWVGDGWCVNSFVLIVLMSVCAFMCLGFLKCMQVY